MKFSKKIILASASPRRTELLTLGGVEHSVMVADIDESAIRFIHGQPENYVISIAKAKNQAVYDAISAQSVSNPPSLIISADTVVCSEKYNGLSLPIGKPHSEEEARAILEALSGEVHTVVTGVVIRDTESGNTREFAEVSEVEFRPITREEIDDYIASGEPFDKAGAYGIQGPAAAFVRRVNGDYSNIIGLPLCRVIEELMKF